DAADQIRHGHQSQDRQGARPRYSADAARPRRRGDRMNRREFIALVGGAAASSASWPLAVHAQQSERMRRVAVFMDLAEQDAEGQARVDAFKKGLQELGWIEGRNVKLDYRWTAADPGRMRRFAAELVGLAPEVIMNGGLPTLVAMQQETRTIPIVFAQV